ncbi:hypothetical protein LIER_10949 [Lithospermum erythrorhizon]|uniref:Uncharacterized protein n=1 Tax=Lithospermum erythrorhizon TaxID=34254 RepID=A0AAV3PMR9_LITER
MLYSEKPGKASPTRWHKYWFMAKDAFSDDVPYTFSINYTTVEAEDSEVTKAEFQKLVDGFPKPLPLKTFCDPDVVVKAGLCKGPNNFPNMSLGELLLFKKDKPSFPAINGFQGFRGCPLAAAKLHAEVLRVMKVQSPTRLHQQFAHYQLRATEAAYAMSFQWAELERVAGEFEHPKSFLGEEMRKEELKSNHAATERKLTSELEVVKANSRKMASDLEKSRDDLSRVQSRMHGCMIEKEDLQSRLAKVEDPATFVVEDFKVSHEYLELLKRNTATLVRGFYQNVHADFPSISSHIYKYVCDLGEDYMVDLFDNIPDDEDEGLGADNDEEDEGDEDGDGEDDTE